MSDKDMTYPTAVALYAVLANLFGCVKAYAEAVGEVAEETANASVAVRLSYSVKGFASSLVLSTFHSVMEGASEPRACDLLWEMREDFDFASEVSDVSESVRRAVNEDWVVRATRAHLVSELVAGIVATERGV